MVSLSSASVHKVNVLGTLDVDIRVESIVSRHKFIFSKQLHADRLLGFQLINKAVDSIHIQYKQLGLSM